MSLNIEKKIDGANLEIILDGKLDTTTAPDLDESLETDLDGIEELVFNCKDLVYISSAGLRVILKAQKVMNRQGSMKLTGVNDDIMEIFEVTGFLDFLVIE